MGQNLFTQLSTILRKAGEGNALSLELNPEGERELDVAVELKNRETGETVVSRFHVTGEPEVLDSSFGTAIVEPLREGTDEGGSLDRMESRMERLQEARDAARAAEKTQKGSASQAARAQDGRQEVFKALWQDAVAAKRAGDFRKAESRFVQALEIASPSQKDAVETQIEWCRHQTTLH